MLCADKCSGPNPAVCLLMRLQCACISAPEIDLGESATRAGIGVVNATSRPTEDQGWETCGAQVLGDHLPKTPKSGIHLLPNWF